MKNLRMPLVCLCITVSSICSVAQNHAPLNQPDYNKPKIFNNLPDAITVSVSELETMFRKEAGEQSSFTLDQSRQAHFNGTVVSVSSSATVDNGYRSIVIKSDNYNGARLHLVRARKEDGSIVYEGRIISNQHGDAYLLKSDGNNFVFIKKGYYNLVNE